MESMRVPLGHDDNNTQTFGKFSRSFLIISFVSIFIAAWERTIAPIPNYSLPTYSTYIGLIIFFIGVYLRHLSIKHLGKYFVTKVQVTDDHKLVTNGIYSSLRHPSYTGLILGFLGIILFLQAGLATAIFCINWSSCLPISNQS
jgi:protein-S-isoprenylcysteine O-methyltransferase Ste14